MHVCEYTLFQNWKTEACVQLVVIASFLGFCFFREREAEEYYDKQAKITVLCEHDNYLAAGYSTGKIRVWSKHSNSYPIFSCSAASHWFYHPHPIRTLQIGSLLDSKGNSILVLIATSNSAMTVYSLTTNACLYEETDCQISSLVFNKTSIFITEIDCLHAETFAFDNQENLLLQPHAMHVGCMSLLSLCQKDFHNNFLLAVDLNGILFLFDSDLNVLDTISPLPSFPRHIVWLSSTLFAISTSTSIFLYQIVQDTDDAQNLEWQILSMKQIDNVCSSCIHAFQASLVGSPFCLPFRVYFTFITNGIDRLEDTFSRPAVHEVLYDVEKDTILWSFHEDISDWHKKPYISSRYKLQRGTRFLMLQDERDARFCAAANPRDLRVDSRDLHVDSRDLYANPQNLFLQKDSKMRTTHPCSIVCYSLAQTRLEDERVRLHYLHTLLVLLSRRSLLESSKKPLQKFRLMKKQTNGIKLACLAVSIVLDHLGLQYRNRRLVYSFALK